MPFLSGIEASRQSLARRGVLRSVRMLLAGLQDSFREAVGLSPAYLPVTGPPGQMALLDFPQDEQALYFAQPHVRYEVRIVKGPTPRHPFLLWSLMRPPVP